MRDYYFLPKYTNLISYWQNDVKCRDKFKDAIIKATKHLEHVREFLDHVTHTLDSNIFKQRLIKFNNLCLASLVWTSQRTTSPVNFLIYALPSSNKQKFSQIETIFTPMVYPKVYHTNANDQVDKV